MELRMKKPTLYMLVGIPASGKSTWVSSNQENCAALSTADYIEDRALEAAKTYSEVFSFFIDSATENLNQMLKNAVASNKDVIWDQTNLDVRSRRRKLKDFGQYRKVAVVFQTPDDDVLVARLNSRPGKNIPMKIIESMKLRFELPM